MTATEIKVTVLGNCGKPHSFEEWQRCRACDHPRPSKPWWREQMSNFIEEPNVGETLKSSGTKAPSWIDAPPIPPLHVIVHFGKDIPLDIQGKALLDFERSLRALSGGKLWIEVFKQAKGDDSKLRSAMTAEQRAKL